MEKVTGVGSVFSQLTIQLNRTERFLDGTGLYWKASLLEHQELITKTSLERIYVNDLLLEAS